MAERRGAAILEIRGLNVYYGYSHALQGVDLTLDHGVLSVVGRNGMGKTTLCRAIMGLQPVASGSITFAGRGLVGMGAAEIARLGIGYVPQGRRLWPTLTVDEHLRLAARPGPWTPERIYATFPRLADRRGNGGAQLSGGEQQMLAISRALLTNPRLLVMDEPTEGLAPVIVAQVAQILGHLEEEGDIAVLLIEQNIGVATAAADQIAIVVNGRVNRLMDSAALAADRDLQQRLLGVGRHGHAETEAPATESAAEAPATRGPTRIYLSNPTTPTRWSNPVPVRILEANARTTTEPARPTEPEIRPLVPSGRPVVLVAGTLDTKGAELRFVRDILIAAVLGASAISDAFFVALRVPNMFRRIFAEGAFNAAFIPLYTKKLHEAGEEAAKDYAAKALAGLTAILVLVVLLSEIAAPWLVRWLDARVSA